MCPEVEGRLAAFERQNADACRLLDVPLFLAITLSVCLDDELPQGRGPIRWDLYPGRAGFLSGFTGYALARAVEERLITCKQWRTFIDEPSRVVDGVFWSAMVRHGRSQVFLRADIDSYRQEAFGPSAGRPECREGVWILEQAGLLQGQAGATLRVVHQQIAEHWAARHLARMFRNASVCGTFEDSVWDHLRERRLDPITGQALGILMTDREGRRLAERVYDVLTALPCPDVVWFLLNVGGDWAFGKLTGLLRHGDGSVRLAVARAFGDLGWSDATGRLVEALKDSDKSVCEAAWMALLTIGRRSSDPVSFADWISNLARGAGVEYESVFSLAGSMGVRLRPWTEADVEPPDGSRPAPAAEGSRVVHIQLHLRRERFVVDHKTWHEVSESRMFKIFEFISRPGQCGEETGAGKLESMGIRAPRQVAKRIQPLFERHGIKDPSPIVSVWKSTPGPRGRWLFRWNAEPEYRESLDAPVRLFRAELP